MRKILYLFLSVLCISVFMNVASFSVYAQSDLELGSFRGQEGSIFKKNCYLVIEEKDGVSPYGYTEHPDGTPIKDFHFTISTREVKSRTFKASESHIGYYLPEKRINVLSGSDSIYAGDQLELTVYLYEDGSPSYYELKSIATFFGFTKEKKLATCNNLKKLD